MMSGLYVSPWNMTLIDLEPCDSFDPYYSLINHRWLRNFQRQIFAYPGREQVVKTSYIGCD